MFDSLFLNLEMVSLSWSLGCWTFSGWTNTRFCLGSWLMFHLTEDGMRELKHLLEVLSFKSWALNSSDGPNLLADSLATVTLPARICCLLYSAFCCLDLVARAIMSKVVYSTGEISSLLRSLLIYGIFLAYSTGEEISSWMTTLLISGAFTTLINSTWGKQSPLAFWTFF